MLIFFDFQFELNGKYSFFFSFLFLAFEILFITVLYYILYLYIIFYIIYISHSIFISNSNCLMEWLVITNETFLGFQGKVKIKNKNRSFKYSKLNGKMTGSETYRSGIYPSILNCGFRNDKIIFDLTRVSYRW